MTMRAVIFDFDGVLVNSEPLHYEAMRDALLPEGIEISVEEYERQYLAYDDREAMRVALEVHGRAAGRDDVEKIAKRKAARFDALLHDVPMFDGAQALILELSNKIPIAIASGALHGEIERILSAQSLLSCFDAIVGADDVSQGKPSPEPYLSALERLRRQTADLRAAECLVIEDSMAGIAAGLAAGMRVLGVAHSYPAARLSAAHRVVSSLQGLRASALEALFNEV